MGGTQKIKNLKGNEAREKAGGWRWGLEPGHNSLLTQLKSELSRELGKGYLL